MNSAILATFSDVIGFLAQSFKLTAVFPAFIFALLNEWLVLPHLPQRGLVMELVALDLSGQLVIAAAFALLLGYTLTIVNISLIRLFEGYGWRETRYGRGLTELQEARRQMLMKRILSLENETSQKVSELKKEFARYETGDPQREFLYQQRKGWEKKLAVERTLYEQQIRDYFPAVTPILPTALGNTIAAFEDYSWIRYGIDAVVLWPRLLPTLTEENYAVYVEREKAGLDFTLNMCVLLLLLGLEMIYVGLIFGRDCAVWLIGAGITTFFAFAFYKAGVAGAYSWGTTVRVAFDLYRYHLLRSLYGCPPSKFFSDAKFSSEEAYSAETGIWRRISQFLQEGMDPEKRQPDMSRLLNYSRIKMDVERQKLPCRSKAEENGGE